MSQNTETEFTYNNTKYTITPVFPGEHIFRRIENSKTFYEINLLTTIKKLDLEGTYLDIGANMGNHSIFFINECKCNKLISIEPEPLIYKTLIKNIKKNNYKNIDVETYNCALGNKECNVTMCINPKNTGATKVTDETGSIPCHVLDNLIIDNNIKLIKIDAEGYELKILTGSIKVVTENKPVIVCEAATLEEFIQLDNFLTRLGYKTNKVKLAGTPTFMWIHYE